MATPSEQAVRLAWDMPIEWTITLVQNGLAPRCAQCGTNLYSGVKVFIGLNATGFVPICETCKGNSYNTARLVLK